MKEVIKKQVHNAPKRKDDGKNANNANYRTNTTNVDLTFFRIKLSLTLVQFLSEKK